MKERILSTKLRMEESMATLLVFVYLFVYVYGSRQNRRIAECWFSAVQKPLRLQFAQLGAYTTNEASPVHCDSAYTYKVYCSGRRNCDGVLMTLKLKRRQDLFACVLDMLGIVREQDLCEIEIPLDKANMEPIVFLLAQRREEKRLRKNVDELNQLARTISSSRVPAHLCVLSDNVELEKELLDARVLRTIADDDDLFVSMLFSDQCSQLGSLSQAVARFELRLPNVNDMQRIRQLTNMVFFFIDRVAELRLSVAARKKAQSARTQLANSQFRALHSQRQEMTRKRREEAALATMSDDEKRRYEKRQQRQGNKRRSGQRVKV